MGGSSDFYLCSIAANQAMGTCDFQTTFTGLGLLLKCYRGPHTHHVSLKEGFALWITYNTITGV